MSEFYNNQQISSPDGIKEFLANIATYRSVNDNSNSHSFNAQTSKEDNQMDNEKDIEEWYQENQEDYRQIDVIAHSNSNQIPILYNGWNYEYINNNTISSITNFTIKTLSLKESFQNIIIIYCFLLLSYILFL